MHVSASRQLARLAVRSSVTEPSASLASCSGATSRRPGSISSSSHAANFSMLHTPLSSANLPDSLSAPSAAARPVPHGAVAALIPAPTLAARGALALIRAYKYLLSPWFTGSCRFMPTCADYTAEAIARHGFVRGSLLGARRLSRCQPFGGHGHDPVPPTRPTRLT